MRERFDGWVKRYLKAWNSNERADIEDLFAAEGAYFTEPYAEPWRGREEIVAGWLKQEDEPGDTNFSYEVIAADGDLGIVRGTTDYKSSGKSYSNLWLVRLDDDDRALEFVEYWMLIK
ncbi:MAG: nuclear transport factor 2 family protein [Actinomycetota bacterium]